MVIDIVLLPPKAVSEKIGKFVRKLGKSYHLKMAVDNQKLLPHISLFHIKTLPKHVPAIIKQVRVLSLIYKRIFLKFIKPKTGKDYFVIDLEKTKPLAALHRQVVMEAYICKTGFSGVGNIAGNKQEREYIKKFGAGNVLKNFQPHITLGLVKHKKDLTSILRILLKERWKACLANSLALTQVNHRHQVFKVITEFKLK